MNTHTQRSTCCTDVRPRRGCRPGAGFALAVAAPAVSAAAQCQPGWSAVGPPGRMFGVFALGVHDEDGPGPILPALSVGGFTDTFPNIAPSIARYDGWAWQSMGAGFERVPGNIVVKALLDFPQEVVPGIRGLLAVGIMSSSGGRPVSKGLAMWNGRSWESAVTTGTHLGGLLCAAVFDEDGIGPAPPCLFVSGLFDGIGKDPQFPEAIARWDGLRWSSVGGGFIPSTGTSYALALCVYDDDDQGPISPALYAAGSFNYVGGEPIRNLARWDGTQWSDVGGYHPGSAAYSLLAWDAEGTGHPSLYVSGDLRNLEHRAGGPSIPTPGGMARWNGLQWSTVPGAGGSGPIQAMVAFDDDGPGPNREALFVTGFGIGGGGVNRHSIAKFDGVNWHSMGTGLTGLPFGNNGDALCVFDEDGDGPNPGGLYVGGDFYYAGGVYSPGFARWGCPLPPRCPADCDASTGPGRLDTFDYLCFLNRYSYEDPWACDGDLSTGPRVCDVFDFLWFQNAFANGCR